MSLGIYKEVFKSARNKFETNFKQSAIKQGVYIYKIKDMFVPPECRVCKKSSMKIGPNEFDFIMYKHPYLFTLELKSTKQKSIQITEKIIKEHQINALKKSTKYEGVIAGFVFNFLNYDNQTFFVHINDFVWLLEEKKKSISLNFCQKVGTRINNKLLSVNYEYDIVEFVQSVGEKYRAKIYDD